MRDIFFDENRDNGLRQVFKKIVKEGFDSYIVLAVVTAGNISLKGLKNIGITEL